MICRKCGKQLGDNAKFCRFCGNAVVDYDLLEQDEAAVQNGKPADDNASDAEIVANTVSEQGQSQKGNGAGPISGDRICNVCGSLISKGHKFCSVCGAKVDETQTDDGKTQKPQASEAHEGYVASPNRARKASKSKMLLVAIPVLLICVIGVVAWKLYNTPTAVMNRDIKNSDIEAAYEIYLNELEDKDLSEKTVNLLTAFMSDVQADYEDGSLTYEDAILSLARCYVFFSADDEISDVYNDIYSQIWNSNQFELQMDVADGYYDEEDYLSAWTAYEVALDYDPDSEEATSGVDKAKAGLKATYLSEAQSALNSESFLLARSILEEAMEMYFPDDSDLTEMLEAVETAEEQAAIEAAEEQAALEEAERQAALEEQLSLADELLETGEALSAWQAYEAAAEMDSSSTVAQEGIAEAKAAYREMIINEAAEYVEAQQFDEARSVINEALNTYLSGDSELTAYLSTIDDAEVQAAIDDAYAATEGNDWEGALEILEEAQETYGTLETIQSAYEDIVYQMPITLKNITTVSSSDVDIITSVVTDRWGNVYDGAVSYRAEWDSYALYSLGGEYTLFTATVIVPDMGSNGKSMSLAIYFDEVLVYYNDEITEETEPILLSMDVTDVSTMRIVSDSARGNAGYKDYLYFVDSNFEKVVQ